MCCVVLCCVVLCCVVLCCVVLCCVLVGASVEYTHTARQFRCVAYSQRSFTAPPVRPSFGLASLSPSSAPPTAFVRPHTHARTHARTHTPLPPFPPLPPQHNRTRAHARHQQRRKHFLSQVSDLEGALQPAPRPARGILEPKPGLKMRSSRADSNPPVRDAPAAGAGAFPGRSRFATAAARPPSGSVSNGGGGGGGGGGAGADVGRMRSSSALASSASAPQPRAQRSNTVAARRASRD